MGPQLSIKIELIEEVPNTSPCRYRIADSNVVRELFELNSALNSVGEPSVGATVRPDRAQYRVSAEPKYSKKTDNRVENGDSDNDPCDTS